MIRMPKTLDAICNAANSASTAGADLGAMPEWDLTDLFPSTDGPELAAAIEKAVVDARAFEQAYKGQSGCQRFRWRVSGQGRSCL